MWLEKTFWGQRLGMKGVLAPVCKPLLSVGEVTTKGGAAIMLDDLGYLLTPHSSILKDLRSWLAEEVSKAKHGHVVELHKERNVYNLYVQGTTSEAGGSRKSRGMRNTRGDSAEEMCPAALVGGTWSSGGRRQGHHL